MLHYIENTRISQKNQNKVVLFLHLIVSTGVSTPIKNSTPFFLAMPPFKSVNCPSPLSLGNPPPSIAFLWHPHKSWIFQWTRSVHWGNNTTTLSNTPPQALPPLHLHTVQAPLFWQLPLYVGLLCPPKTHIFMRPPKILKFFILVIFPIHLNFPIRSSVCFKSYHSLKKNSGLFYSYLRKVFSFSKRRFLW